MNTKQSLVQSYRLTTEGDELGYEVRDQGQPLLMAHSLAVLEGEAEDEYTRLALLFRRIRLGKRLVTTQVPFSSRLQSQAL